MKVVYICLIFIVLLLCLFIKNHIGIPADKIYDLDKTSVIFLSTMNTDYNFLFKGNDYNLKLDDRWAGYFAQNIFIINENMICLVINNKIFFYDFKNALIVKILHIEDDSIAINTNNKGDLLIFSGGDLYKYYIEQDKLIKLKKLVEDQSDYTLYYPSLYIHPNKISYSKKRNSVFYSAYINPETRERGIYELSLEDFSVRLRGKGFCPQVNDEKETIYYINDDQNSILKLSYDGSNEEKLLTYTEAIRDMVVIDEETIFFAHAAAKANIKGVKFSRYKVYDKGTLKYIKTEGSILRPPFDVMKIE